jgi:hypothetical protein
MFGRCVGSFLRDHRWFRTRRIQHFAMNHLPHLARSLSASARACSEITSSLRGHQLSLARRALSIWTEFPHVLNNNTGCGLATLSCTLRSCR